MTAAASVFHLGDQAKSRKVGVKTEIDPELLIVEHNFQMPALRVRPPCKYDEVFRKLKPGSAIRCEPDESGPISHSLKKNIRLGDYPALAGCIVKALRRLPDGHGRVVVMLPKSE